MFLTRMRVVAATVALVATAPLVTLGPANAEPTGDKPERRITIKGVEPRPNVFFAKGRVGQDYTGGAVMQRKLKSQEKWRPHHTFRLGNDSRYRERIAALNRVGVVCYRVKVKGNDAFKTSYSRRVCIETKRG